MNSIYTPREKKEQYNNFLIDFINEDLFNFEN